MTGELQGSDLRAAPGSPSPGLRELLPEYYRENPWEMGPALNVADEMFASIGAHLHRALARLSDDSMRALRERWFPSRRKHCAIERAGRALDGGTPRELRRWMRLSFGRAPDIRAGFEVVPAGADRLEVRRSRRPAAVIVWDPEGLPEPLRPLSFPRDMIPLRTRLQVILPLSDEDVSVSCHGRVVKARILFDSHLPDVEA
jgi:hypothetical protein